MVQEVTSTLMKTIPLLPSQPFKAVHAVGAVGAPTHGCYIQYHDHEQDDDQCHHALLFSFVREGCSCYTFVKDADLAIWSLVAAASPNAWRSYWGKVREFSMDAVRKRCCPGVSWARAWSMITMLETTARSNPSINSINRPVRSNSVTIVILFFPSFWGTSWRVTNAVKRRLSTEVLLSATRVW